MAITSMARILASVAMIIFAGAVAAGATGAFFSDTETSTGNTFTAGSLDLQIDNESFVTNSSGVLEASPTTSWGLNDAMGTFFNFSGLQPVAMGEDTISVHVNGSDSWACIAAKVTATPETDQNESEAAVDPTAGANEGELQTHLEFAFWADDGDNVYEDNEAVLWSGTAASIFDGSWQAIADATGPAFYGNTALTGGSTVHVAKAWCFGNLATAPVADDADTDPVTRGATGFSCVSDTTEDEAQSDGVTADVSFYATQSNNNAGFECSSLPTLGS